MKVSITLIMALVLLINGPIPNKPLRPDKEQIQSILANASTDLTFLDQIGTEKSRLDLAFVLDRKASHRRLSELNFLASKLDPTPRPPGTPQPMDEVLLFSSSLRFAKHLSTQKAHFQANPNSNGTRIVRVRLMSSDQKPAVGWRVGFMGENDLPYDVKPGDRVDEVCAKRISLVTGGESPHVSKQEPPPPGSIDVQVVVGSIYLWIKHPDYCSPRAEVKQFTDPTSVDLTAPSEKP
jgi:hypothetical protein